MEQRVSSETTAYKIHTHWGITLKKAYNIQNTAKILNQESINSLQIMTKD